MHGRQLLRSVLQPAAEAPSRTEASCAGRLIEHRAAAADAITLKTTKTLFATPWSPVVGIAIRHSYCLMDTHLERSLEMVALGLPASTIPEQGGA